MSTVSKAFLQIFKYATEFLYHICEVCQQRRDRHIMYCPVLSQPEPGKFQKKGTIAMNDHHSCGSCTCGFSVAVEYGQTPCYFEEQYFDIEIRCSDGTPAAAGKVEGGSSAYFTLPCDGVYSVTVSGPSKFSPRSQTKRVQCRRDCSNGATFIFNSLAPMQPHPPKPEEPCRPDGHCKPDGHCRPEKPRRELSIRCSRNGITIIE